MLTPGFFKQEEQTDLWFWFVPLEFRPSLPASSHTDLAPSFCCLKHPSFLPSIFPSSLFSPQSCFQELIMSFHLSLCLPHSLHPPSAFPPASFCLETSSPSPSSPPHTHTLPFHLHPFLNVSPSFGPSIHPSCCMRSISVLRSYCQCHCQHLGMVTAALSAYMRTCLCVTVLAFSAHVTRLSWLPRWWCQC